MKKKLFVLIATLMLVTSCSPDKRESGPGKAESPPPSENSVYVPNKLYIDSLPDIGEFSGKTDGGRFYDEITYDFIPSDEYGTVVPYVSSYRVFETPKEEGSDWHAEQGYASYGFCTPDGKIVMDASYKNTYVYYNETNDGFGYYIMSREVNAKEDAPDEFVPSEQLIIPKDGSWCLTLEGDRMWLSSSGGGYLAVVEYPVQESDGVVKIHLYDYNGNLVKTLEGIDNIGVYSCGLMMVSSWENNTYTTWFISEENEMVLGPYNSASNFNSFGVANVEDELGAYIINTEGKAISGLYQSIFRDYHADASKQLFVARHLGEEKKADVFSADGKFLKTVDGAYYISFNFPENNRILYHYTKYDVDENGKTDYKSERIVWKFLDDDSDFVSKEFGVSPNSYINSDNCFSYTDSTARTGYFFDGNGETIAVIDNLDGISDVSENGEYIIYNEWLDDEVVKTHIYDSEKGEIAFTVDTATSAYFVGKDDRFIVVSVFDNAVFGGESNNYLFDTLSGEVVFSQCPHISVNQVNDELYINVCHKNYCALYDKELKPIIKKYYE